MHREEVEPFLNLLESTGGDPARLNLRVGDNEWSAAQVLRHLVLTHGPYWQAMRLHAANATGTYSPDAEFKPGFMNGLILKSMSVPGKRSGTMSALEPGDVDAAEAWQQWQSMLTEYREVLTELEGKDLNARFRHPRLPLATMSHAEGLELFRVHLNYHKFQFDPALAG